MARVNTAPRAANAFQVPTSNALAPRTRKAPPEAKQLQTRTGNASKRGVAAQVNIVGINAKLRIRAFDYGTHKPKQATVTQAPSDGKLDLAVVMSVSGHTSQAAQFAKTNKYTIQVTFPDGTTKTVKNIPSGGEYATIQNISFNLKKGKTLVDAWPQGSAGVHGYIEGRRTVITY